VLLENSPWTRKNAGKRAKPQSAHQQIELKALNVNSKMHSGLSPFGNPAKSAFPATLLFDMDDDNRCAVHFSTKTQSALGRLMHNVIN